MKDITRLRELAKKVRELAESPDNKELINKWFSLDIMTAGPPLILTETDGGLGMVVPEFAPLCEEPWAQGQEWGLMATLVHKTIICDDYPIEPRIGVGWNIKTSGYGVEVKKTRPETEGFLGAYHIDPPIKNLKSEMDKLKHRTFEVDRESTNRHIERLSEVFDGILDVELRGNPWWTLGMTWTAIDLVGLDNLMLLMYDEPDALHSLMGFLRDDCMHFLDWLESESLLNLNNLNDYIGSGSRGYTKSLPSRDYRKGARVKTQDMWTLLESQETVGVGPSQFAEFIFPYQNDIAKRFGRVYYGCCEPVNNRWHVIKGMANMKRVSVSPWCDERFMAEALAGSYVYSRKPAPSLISTPSFDEDAIRVDLRNTMLLVKSCGCALEIIMKDVHTLSGDSSRLTKWVAIAREVSAEVYG